MNSGKTTKRKNKLLRLCIGIFLMIVIIMTLYIINRINIIHNNETSERQYINKLKSTDKQSVNNYNNNVDEQSNYTGYNDTINSNGYIISAEYTNNNSNVDNDNNCNNTKTDNIGDCIIEIPDINLSKIVYSGNERDNHLNNYELVTATSDMKYSQGGNYIICGHASRLYGHSLNRIKEITKGTEIIIFNNNKTDKYIVNKVYFANMNETDKYCIQTNKRELTIISCAKYISKESYIVIKAIPNQ